MDPRRNHLKELARRFASDWAASAVPLCLTGESRFETRNTIYQIRDGICHTVIREVEEGHGTAVASEMTGMRVVAWLGTDGAPTLSWEPGLRAVLWRPRADGSRSAIAMTSRSIAFRKLNRSAPPPRVPARRTDTPPPLPSVMVRPSVVPPPPNRDASPPSRTGMQARKGPPPLPRHA
jgi:hypothetical protein